MDFIIGAAVGGAVVWFAKDAVRQVIGQVVGAFTKKEADKE